MDLVALLLLRDNQPMLQPEADLTLKPGDQILFCGQPAAKDALPLTLSKYKALSYILDGTEIPDGLIWRWVSGKLEARRNGKGSE